MAATIDESALRVGAALAARRLLLVTAESCTAGGVAYAITQVPGSSAWFERGYVTYSNQAKQDCLGVAAADLIAHGAVSEPVARAMALGSLTHSRAQVSVAVTGIAGPDGGSAAKPVGTVCFAWARVIEGSDAPLVRTRTRYFDGDRAAVRSRSIVVALEGIVALLGATAVDEQG